MAVKFGSILELNNATKEATLDSNNLRGTTIQIDDFTSASLAKIGSGLTTAPGKRRLGTIVSTTGSATSPPRYYVYSAISDGDSNISGSNWTTLTNWKEIQLSSNDDNSFGSTSDTNHHAFTGSVTISSSFDNPNTALSIISGISSSTTNVFTIVSSSTNVLTINGDGKFIGSNIVSGAVQITGEFATTDDIIGADAISGSWQGYISGSGIVSGASQIFNSETSVEFNSITASGDISSSGTITAAIISSSGDLFFSSSNNDDTSLRVVVVDVNTGQLFRTGAYAEGGGSSGGPISLNGLENDIIPLFNDDISLGTQDKKFKNIFAINTFFGGIHEINLATEGLDKMQEGTVLSLKNSILHPCEKEGDPLVMGVVSKGENYPIVLGAEPILITGKIKEGDYIITSNVKGHGKGVNPYDIYNKQLFGKIIAQAIENGEGESYTIKAMIRKM